VRKNTPNSRTGSAWEKLVTHVHFSPTPEGFMQAWIQTCGHRPTPQQMDEFREMVRVRLSQKTTPVHVKPAPQPTLWPDEKETR